MIDIYDKIKLHLSSFNTNILTISVQIDNAHFVHFFIVVVVIVLFLVFCMNWKCTFFSIWSKLIWLSSNEINWHQRRQTTAISIPNGLLQWRHLDGIYQVTVKNQLIHWSIGNVSLAWTCYSMTFLVSMYSYSFSFSISLLYYYFNFREYHIGFPVAFSNYARLRHNIRRWMQSQMQWGINKYMICEELFVTRRHFLWLFCANRNKVIINNSRVPLYSQRYTST